MFQNKNPLFQKRLFSRASPAAVFGLEISDGSLKIAQLRYKRRQASVDVLYSAKIPKDIIVNGDINNLAALVKIMKSTGEKFEHTLTRGVIAGLPEAKTFLQVINIPKKNEMPFANRLSDVMPEYVPLDTNEMYFDSTIISESATSWTALVGAAPRKTVDDYLSLISQAGFMSIALDLEATAVANALIADSESSPKPRAIIDLGARRASLIVHDYGVPQFTIDVPIAGDAITEEIARTLDLSLEQAEKAKRTCGLHSEKCEGALRQILEKMVADLTDKIQEGRDYYQTHFPHGRDLSEIILCGGGAYLISLDKVLQESISIPVRQGNIWENIEIITPPKLDFPLRFAAVIGLARRGGSLTANL